MLIKSESVCFYKYSMRKDQNALIKTKNAVNDKLKIGNLQKCFVQ